MFEMSTKLPKIIVILGPTATGKSDFAVDLAKQFGGEIISADSRQVYKGLDLGTGKITKREMRGVPHHLLDVASANRVFTASDYARLAKHAISKIAGKGKLPIICGGTGFYIVAALERQSLAPVPPNTALRKKLTKKSASKLFSILKKIDPERARTIDAKNSHRLIRAIEIAKAIGKSPARNREEEYDALKIGLNFPLETLKRRIDLRLKKRLRLGLIKEVEHLHEKGLSFKRMEALGLEYRYISRFLRGILTRKQMEEELSREIFKFAKRQNTWFKKDNSIHWVKNIKEAKILIKKFL
ncbi:MAG: tRNA delta(2)-isopentenylpyrophosphate transferase [Parcubacteria group bacterium LiPW_15]|nr:MAG: tRNA delta(2)-isopentenylpyrophosphate transferase [Parcubacteria group bacterium LiPW_15]